MPGTQIDVTIERVMSKMDIMLRGFEQQRVEVRQLVIIKHHPLFVGVQYPLAWRL